MEIKVDKLTYNTIFKDTSFNLKSNKISSIVGKNSSGKTTLLNILYKISNGDSGDIKIGKKKLTKKMSNSELNKFRKDIFYIKQDYETQFVEPTIFKDIKNLCGKEDICINDLLKEFNLSNDILKKSYFELSSGELKKILIISMILSDSKLLLLDDPTIGLDEKGIFLLVKWLKKLKREEKTIVLTSNDSNFILKVTDDIYMITDCKIVHEADIYNILEDFTQLNKLGLEVPKIIEFRKIALKQKKIKLLRRDDINDLIKDVYRNAR